MEAVVRVVLKYLPLAEAMLWMLGYVLQEDRLQRLYEQYRGRTYGKVLSFVSLVELIRDALLQHAGSGRASFERAQEQDRLEVAISNVYGKLSRLPVTLSVAFLHECSRELEQLLPPGQRHRLPASLDELDPIGFDGKVIKHIPRRLAALRHLRGRMVGGRILAALCLRSGLVLAINASEDGMSNDCPLVAGLLDQVRRRDGRKVLWIGDRQFCDLKLMGNWVEQGEHFVIRYNRSTHFQPDAARPGLVEKDDQEREVVQQWGWLGAAGNRHRRYVRLITLKRPKPSEEVILATDLLDDRKYPAADLLEVYLRRWGLEQMFQQVVEVFHLRRLIGTHPRATIFQASFCLLLYNLIQVMRGYAAQAGQVPVEAVSTEKLFGDTQRQLTAWCEVVQDQPVAQALAPLPSRPTLSQVRHRLQTLLEELWREHWLKSKSARRPPPQRRKTTFPKSGFTSVHRALEPYRQRQRRKKRRERATPKRQ